MSRSFDQYSVEVAQEAEAEGREAVRELEAFRRHFALMRHDVGLPEAAAVHAPVRPPRTP